MAQFMRERGRTTKGMEKENIILKMEAITKANGQTGLGKVKELNLSVRPSIIEEVGKITKKKVSENSYKGLVTFIKVFF
jgi:hypothetical protein